MAEQMFIRILNMSFTGAFVIFAVLVMRLFLKKMPKIFSYCLWAVVLFRLLCPVSFSITFSPLSAIRQLSVSNGRVEYIPEDIAEAFTGADMADFGADDADAALTGQENTPAGERGEQETKLAVKWGSVIWLLGIGAMGIYSVVTLAALKRKLKTAVREKDNLYVTPKVGTPFVIGLFRPRIYLPASLKEEEKRYVLLHEQIHLERKDHIIKVVAFGALCIHWFNPLVWAAFFLSGKDMEMSCDEAVIRRLGSSVKKEYSTSLLCMATGRRIVNGIPLAFGEGDTGSRIKNVLHYKKPAAVAAGVTAAACCVAAVILLANPGGAGNGKTEETVRYYGVVADVWMDDGTSRRLIVVPGIGEVEIPEAESVYTYFERDEQELLPGDMVEITFLKGKDPASEQIYEVEIQETYPASFSRRAESIVVKWESCALEHVGGDAYRFTFPGGIVSGPSAMEPGDILSIYREEEEDPEHPAYLSQVPESENSRLLAVTPVFAVGETDDGVKVLTVELSADQLQSIFAGFGFCIRFEPGMDEELTEEQKRALQEKTDGLQEGMITGENDYRENVRTGDETYRVSVRSVSRSARVIDTYIGAEGSSYDGGEPLAFADDCVFKVNYSMDGIDLKEVSFDDFADLIGEGEHWLNKPCLLTFKDGLITEAVLQSAWEDYGIYFSSFSPDAYTYEFLMENEGEAGLEKYYTLASTESLDIADCEGMETIEVYTGNLGDGDSGIVMFKDKEGNLLCVQDVHRARVGWGNIYLGETEEGAFIMNVDVEDRWDFGGYGYWVYRLDEEGGIRQIAGSRFDFDFTEYSSLTYDDELFKEWAEGMTSWLENSHLILSSQEGEVRTEKISEADKYNYDTLSLKDREFE